MRGKRTTLGRVQLQRRSAGGMNGLESRYAESLRASPDVLLWQYESVKLRLADSTFYTPDFLVVTNEGFVELHEVKGFWRDDARVKIKVAAATFPFTFRAATWNRRARQWDIETFRSRGDGTS